MTPTPSPIAFIGGGNMAGAIIGGLRRDGWPGERVIVVEPLAESRERLQRDFGVTCLAAADAALAAASLVVWAVKPQVFRVAAQAARASLSPDALHLSVAAGIRMDSIANWLGLDPAQARLVRCMPNTPALVGRGMTGLFASPGVDAGDRQRVEDVLHATGELAWLQREDQLDAVTALSGSGPAYVFFFLEAMVQAGVQMGLSQAQAHQLAVQTFVGASHLAQDSSESPTVLRERVTSKGGTTHAAICSMQADAVDAAFVKALKAACDRARVLGDEFGAQ